MRLKEIRREIRDGAVRLSGIIESPGGEQLPAVWFEYEPFWEPFLNPSADVFAPLLLPVCMSLRQPFESDLSIDPFLLSGLNDFQDIFAVWYPKAMVRVPIRAPLTAPSRNIPPPENNRVGAFFSAGVDSFYTLLKTRYGIPRNTPEITHLLFLHGLESFLDKRAPDTEARIREIAAEAGLPVVIGATNLRTVFPLDWGHYYCGPGLAAVGLSLAAGFSHVLIPSSSSYRGADLYPWSTHPLTDPLWSTSYLRIRQDGCEATRGQKMIRVVGRDPIALRSLRVCTENEARFRNCGRCPKCLRAMVALRLMGSLDRCGTLPRELDSRLITRINFASEVERGFMLENLEIARETEAGAALSRTLERFLARESRKQALWNAVSGTSAEKALMAVRKGWRGITRLRPGRRQQP